MNFTTGQKMWSILANCDTVTVKERRTHQDQKMTISTSSGMHLTILCPLCWKYDWFVQKHAFKF